jgi:hypothetical protein
MRARMLVDARRADLDVEYKVGQEIEGPEAEHQIAVGQAEVIEPTLEEAKADAKQDAAAAKPAAKAAKGSRA